MMEDTEEAEVMAAEPEACGPAEAKV